MNSSISSSEKSPQRSRNRSGADSYLFYLLGSLAAGVLFIVSFNIAVDPFDVFQTPKIRYFNNVKPKRDADGARISVGFDIARGGYRTLLLGSSRMAVGFPTQIDELPGRELRAGLAGANIFELVRAGTLAASVGDLTCVFILLDFNAFNSVAKVKGSYWNSPLVDGNTGLAKMRTALSFSTLQRSFQTVVENWKQPKDGEATPPTPSPARQRYMYEAMLRHFFPIYRSLEYDRQHTEFLAVMVNRFVSAGKQIVGMISPLHAWQEEAIFAAGRKKSYIAWRNDLARIFDIGKSTSAEKKPCVPGPAAQLWDFAGYQSTGRSPVPDPAQHRPGKYYMETSHFLPEVGRAMFLHIAGLPLPDGFSGNGFATRLHQKNIALENRQMLARRDAWLAGNKDGKVVQQLLSKWIMKDKPWTDIRRFYLQPEDFQQLREKK